jgi:hypothetical protein
MWIFTVNGFFTIIQDRKDANYVWLRARLREDIERNFPGVTVEEHPGADYLFRAKLPREQVAQRVMELVMENNVTSHFKDVMIRTASKPVHGSRSKMLYGVWHSGADMQPYAPYSKTPRPAPMPITPSKGGLFSSSDGRGKGGFYSQRGSEDRGLYGGMGGGFRASEFDWDSRSWGGTSSPDPALPSGRTVSEPGPEASDDELSEWWAMLTPEEQQAYLDETEDQLRRAEAEEETRAVEVVDVLPAPANRPGIRRQRRKAKRKNRHNQEQHSGHAMTDAQYAQYAQERRDGKHGKQQQDRQTFLDKQKAEKIKGAWN